ncbi:hypothetical protein ASPZODRAFT_18901 [Penicilliopsis zonata CBS 506.65]|uniref:DNA repair protein Rad26 n=1 Tax=Penicilliopsis zonata CBS 506.65 TaxID=1073090 RepID=A0A1L9SAI4_9EURO|nr:hypothetical protein ASPZODRAFT_18901 [Penicilliopsis zonata CBS 506.65]OJJ44137.1 hypothetical protein ASPZODRAFT_18901 [Penicilliopsis zonata CBS 506.65]
MEDNDEDFFSDDGFDSLPPGTLFELEQSAYQATQAQRAQSQQPTAQEYSPAQSGPPDRQIRSRSALNVPSRLHTGLTSEYGTLDVGDPDAEVLEDDNIQSAALGQYAAVQEHPMDYMAVQDQNAEGQMDWERHEMLHDTMMVEEVHSAGIQVEIQELTTQIEELTRQNERILRELSEAKNDADTKAGEISIIRSNQARVIQNLERQMAALRKSMADESAKHKEEVEAARAEGKMLATENAFLKQDLAEEALRLNNLKTKIKSEAKEPPITPRKSRVLPFRDGFDDDEITVVSPSKSTERRSKKNTPTVPGKRKRKLSQDSLTPTSTIPLQLSAEAPPLADTADDELLHELAEEHYEQPSTYSDNRNARFMTQILNHRSPPTMNRDIEEMARLAYPSEPQRMLSSIILEETASLNPKNYPVGYAACVASLWSRALKEKFFRPVPMFMSIVQFILALDMRFIPQLIGHLVPVLQEAGDINGVPRFRNSPVSRKNLGQIRQTPQSELQPEVDSTEMLTLLYDMACGCLHVESALRDFWQFMRYDFVLMMLNSSQPIRDIILTINLLSTSISPTSFGSLRDSKEEQAANEKYIVDRLANLLSEMPQVDEGDPPYTSIEICSLRLEALSLLAQIAFNSMAPDSTHGSSVIASHPTVLARLFRAMHDELDALYSYPPERDLHSALVNQLMHLIYSVIQRHKEGLDLQSKLVRVAGGKQKFLVVLTRLAFSDGPVLEEGITDETVEMAHEILDDAVNPQEAEALLEVFPSAKRED